VYYGAVTNPLQIDPLQRDAILRIGRALADPTRSRILLRLLDGSAYPADLVDALSISKQSASNHLACLRDCGIVVAEPEGRRVRYEIADPRLAHALRDLLGVVLAVDHSAHCTPTAIGDCCAAA
jgi:DNA-binding transcriptional ArsR family regulator